MSRNDFKPNLTPKECIQRGIFGGIYFNPIGGKPGILSKTIDIDYKEFPDNWFNGLHKSMYLSRKYNKDINMYKVVAGSNQAFWESKNWIHPQDPRGWFQWYMRYYMGRRSSDDERQIRRWLNVAGENGRWRKYLMNLIISKCKTEKDLKKYVNDFTISPKVRQTLLHWGYELNLKDLKKYYLDKQ